MNAKSLRILSFVAVLASGAAVAQTSDGEGDVGPDGAHKAAMAQMREHDARERKRFEYLSASGSPRDWAMASQLIVVEFPPDGEHDSADFAERFRQGSVERASLLRNAAAAAPRDTLVQWLALNHMPRTSAGCSSSALPQERIDAVLALEPDNALAWTATLGQAVAAKDEIAIDTVLARMAAARRFDDHGADYALALVDIDRRFPDTVQPATKADDGQENVSAFAAAVMHGFIMGSRSHGFGDVCDAGKQVDADIRRFAVCADLGRRLSLESPRLSLRNAGFALLRESAQFDAADAERERELQWQQAQMMSVENTTADESRALLSVGMAAWLERQDDVAALRAMLAHRGIATTPPAGWQPPEPAAEDVETEQTAD